MKNNNIIVLAGGLAAMVTGQQLSDCAKLCHDNMTGLAGTLDCGNFEGAEITRCLCGKANYVYGIQDCSQEACSTAEAEELFQYAQEECQSYGINWTSVAGGADGTVVPEASEIATGAESDRVPETVTSAIADITSVVESAVASGIATTFTSDGTTYTTHIPVEDISSDISAPTQSSPETSPTNPGEGDGEPSESADPSATDAEGDSDDSPALRIAAPIVGSIIAAGVAAILL